MSANKNTIKVVDSIMGSGKTSWAFEYINLLPNDKPVLYITPYLEEIKRCIASCPTKKFVEPEKQFGSKTYDFKDQLIKGVNIAATHSLFRLIDQEALELIKSYEYVLIMDEVMDIIDIDDTIDSTELKDMIDSDIIKLKGTNVSKIKQVESGTRENLKKYEHYRKMASNNRLIYFQNKALIWLFPANVFEAFSDVYNLTYLFDGSLQKAYYDLHKIQYDFYSIVGDRTTGYDVMEYDQRYDQADIKVFAKNVSVHDSKLNGIGRKIGTANPLSERWYRNNQRTFGLLRNNLKNYFTHIVHGRANVNMWTTFKKHKCALQGNGYTSGFLSKNTRCTNDYRHKKNLAYMIDVYPKPEIVHYFKYQNVNMDLKLYALSEMIQWMWRSRIRQHKPINIYVPSNRMRGLLQDWLDGQIG